MVDFIISSGNMLAILHNHHHQCKVWSRERSVDHPEEWGSSQVSGRRSGRQRHSELNRDTQLNWSRWCETQYGGGRGRGIDWGRGSKKKRKLKGFWCKVQEGIIWRPGCTLHKLLSGVKQVPARIFNACVELEYPFFSSKFASSSQFLIVRFNLVVIRVNA